jgi:hypothetical protein
MLYRLLPGGAASRQNVHKYIELFTIKEVIIDIFMQISAKAGAGMPSREARRRG